MSLQEWTEQHRDDLRPELPQASVIADLRAVAARELGDADSVRSDDGKLEHAFAACLAVAAAAFSACGYRMRHGSLAHHWRLVESLQFTLGLKQDEVGELQDLRRKRSRSMYVRTGQVSAEEAQSAVAVAERLSEKLGSWLAREHPDLR